MSAPRDLASPPLDLTRIEQGIAAARRGGYSNQLVEDLAALLAALRELREVLADFADAAEQHLEVGPFGPDVREDVARRLVHSQLVRAWAALQRTGDPHA